MSKSRPPAEATHRVACDGFSFSVPLQWNLSVFDHPAQSSRLDLEDDYYRRLELEWTRPAGKVELPRVQKKFAKASKKLEDLAKSVTPLAQLPSNWVGFLYNMPEGERLITAYCLAPTHFLFFTLHFEPKDKRDPRKTLDLITSTLQFHDKGNVPWECYDLAFELGADFKLVEKSFVAGRKLMIFQWRLRRLYVWLISVADLALKNRPPEVWAAEFLNTVKGLRGVRFLVDEKRAITTRRRRTHFFGHSQEIFRLCFRYQTGVQHLTERNQLFLWVYNYRRADDLRKLEGFRFLDTASGSGQ